MTYPMIPPPELVQLLRLRSPRWSDGGDQWLIEQAYAAGADAELEACEEFLHAERVPGYACQLRAARRPRPTRKELALAACATALAAGRLSPDEASIIRLALEAQP